MPEKISHNNTPWSLKTEWDQVFLSIKRIEKIHGKRCDYLYDTAKDIRLKYEEISDSIEMVCSHTCVDCEDICCIRATIWFDLKDLLYMYFGLKKFPESQVEKQMKENKKNACCNFTKNGCFLNRFERPFVCTWYFCPTQTQYLNSRHPELKQTIGQTLQDIKELRNRMEEEFIKISGPPIFDQLSDPNI